MTSGSSSGSVNDGNANGSNNCERGSRGSSDEETDGGDVG